MNRKYKNNDRMFLIDDYKPYDRTHVGHTVMDDWDLTHMLYAFLQNKR